eukprot:TRINITY_DN16512_c0_g1_i1.p1 TRINITY_DN16512_c0_g1~~TRINITY_DN16512_c0_g1_i1.p1  ORF type:complete len:506 (-),score=87.49 TRINITY_DN16512_c0_g1_i1:229-1626(-)
MTTKGSAVVKANGTTFLSKFCFTYSDVDDIIGNYTVRLWAPNLQPDDVVNVLLLDDEADSYTGPSSEWDSLSCEDKMARAKRVMPIHASARRVEGFRRIARLHEKVRPRWWYFAAVSCSDADVYVEYEVTARNLPYGRFFGEFSTHQRYYIHIFVLAFFVHLVLLGFQLRAVAIIKALAGDDNTYGKAKRPFVTLLTLGVALEVLSCLLSLVHYGLQGKQGHGLHVVYVVAKALSMVSKFCLVSLLLFVSQGKCVSYILVRTDVTKMARLLAPFLVSDFMLEVWAERAQSLNYTTDWVYSTPLGWVIVLMDIALLCVYLSNLNDTLEVERGRGDERFYRRWGVIYAVWFLAMPLAALLSSVVLATYVRHTVSLIITQAANAGAFASLIAGLWPSNPHAKFRLAFAPVEDIMENCVTPPTKRRPPRIQGTSASPESSPGGEFSRNGRGSKLCTTFPGFLSWTGCQS